MVSIQSSNGYLFHEIYFQMINNFCIIVLKQCLSGLELIRDHSGIFCCSPNESIELMHYGAVALDSISAAVCTLGTFNFSL